MANRDRDNWGRRTGGGGEAPAYLRDAERRKVLESLRTGEQGQLVDDDPFVLHTHLGTLVCKLCRTNHRNAESYNAHALGKKHKAAVKRFLLREKIVLVAEMALEVDLLWLALAAALLEDLLDLLASEADKRAGTAILRAVALVRDV